MDIFSASCHFLAQAASTGQLGFVDKANACWKRVKEPTPTPATVIEGSLSQDGLSADPEILRRNFWRVWQLILQRESSFS